MSSSVVSSYGPVVPSHSKSSSDIVQPSVIVNEAIDDSVRKCLSARLPSDSSEASKARKAVTPSPHLATHTDQPMDLTTPSVSTSKSNLALVPSSLHSSSATGEEDETEEEDRRQKQKDLVDSILFRESQISSESPSPNADTTPLPGVKFSDSDSAPSTEEQVAPPQVGRSAANKRKCEHPTKVDFQKELLGGSAAKQLRKETAALSEGGSVDARQLIQVAKASLKDHLSTVAISMVDDIMNQLENYFCVAPHVPPGSKVSKSCQTEFPGLGSLLQSASQQQLQSLATTYSELLGATNTVSTGSNSSSTGQSGSLLGNSSAGQTRTVPSPPSLLSQFGGPISTLYSPVSPQQNQAAAVAAALASANSASRTNGSSGGVNAIASLLPPQTFGATPGGYYNPYLSGLLNNAAFQQLFQQQQQQQQQQKQATTAAAAALLNNLSGNSKKFSAASLIGQQTSQSSQRQSPTPQGYPGGTNPSTSSIDFMSLANMAKRKRTKVTDTRLSARTARKLLDNSFQGGAVDADLLNADSSVPEKRNGDGLDSAGRDDDEALALIKQDGEDFENDERVLLDNGADDLVDEDDADVAAENMTRTRVSPSNVRSSVSSRVSGLPDDDFGDGVRQAGLGQNQVVLPFTPNRSHHPSSLDPSFLAEQSAALQQSSLALGFPMGKTSTLTSMHLRKAKLMFFYVRYPSSSVLKIYFPDVSFNKNNTAQLVKWFSNFREFYYINIEKYGRQLVAEGNGNVDDVDIGRNSELFKVLNLHYNRNNQLQVPGGFVVAVRTTVREFMRAILLQKDQDPSWKKQIYKVIARLDEPLPPFFRDINWMHQLLAD